MSHQVSAVLLAAGLSRRMGRLKQLLPLGDRPAVVHCLESIIGAGIEDIVVVLRPDSLGMAELIAPFPVFPVTVAQGESPGAEMIHSLRTGLGKVSTASSGVLVCLADHPLVRTETITAIHLCHRNIPERIIIPLYRGRRGHPPLLPRRFIEEVYVRPTLRELIGSHRADVYGLDVDDEGVVLDMDTWDDYQKLCRRFPLSP